MARTPDRIGKVAVAGPHPRAKRVGAAEFLRRVPGKQPNEPLQAFWLAHDRTKRLKNPRGPRIRLCPVATQPRWLCP